ncbi:MAG: UDP-2,4-diacetamido-2,4,6-trideoxy-beta-L-altropyranose hydrolase [Pontibacter sp.]|nr:UDP-2,4-diacetamido-2,4,6-trideoxy-beta-L-altropyranose hydrolase [Pontibacter sp.]
MTKQTAHTARQRIVFRADGNSRIGLGHVVRSLALAQMLRQDYECVFAIQAPSPELQEQIRHVCDGVIVLPACGPDEERFAHELEAYIAEDVIVVLDGYNFKTEYQQNIKRRGSQLLYIDDLQNFPIAADVVLNQAGGVDAAKYKTAPYTKLLLGPQYALLRPPFIKAAKAKRVFPATGLNLFLNLGGADPDNHTLRIAQELEQLEEIEKVEIVVGSAYQHTQALEHWMSGRQKYKLHQNLDAEALSKLMKNCAMAVTSSSGVSYEYASVGGLLFVLQTADNQAGLYTFLTQNGVAYKYEQLVEVLQSDVSGSFKAMVKAQRIYFDGKSGDRLRQVFQHLTLAASISMREATPDDLMLLFDWANDPDVRKQSFNPNPILLASHTRWLHAKLEDEQAKLYIAESHGVPAAHIRFEVEDGKAIISYLIGAGFRGKGLGHVVLQRGVAKLLRQKPTVRLVEGLVQPENIASVRAFEKAGFSQDKPDPKYPKAFRFVLAV